MLTTQENEPTDKQDAPLKKSSSKIGRKITVLLFLAFIAASPFIAQFAADKYANEKVSALLAPLNGYCTINHSPVVYNIWNRNLIIKNIEIVCGGENVATIVETVFTTVVDGSPVPSNLIADIKGGVLNPQAKALGDLSVLAGKLGYGSVPFEGHVAYTLGKVSKEFSLNDFKVTAEGVGDISAELKIPAVTAKTLKGVINNIWENRPAELWVSFKNKDLAGRFIAYYATVTETDVAKAKAGALRGLENRISRKFKTDTPARERLVQLYRFFQNPTELVLKLNAKENVSLKDIYDGINYKGWRAFTDSLAKFKPEIFTN